MRERVSILHAAFVLYYILLKRMADRTPNRCIVEMHIIDIYFKDDSHCALSKAWERILVAAHTKKYLNKLKSVQLNALTTFLSNSGIMKNRNLFSVFSNFRIE